MAREISIRGGFSSNIFCNQTKSQTFHCQVCFDVCRSPVTCRSGAHLFCLDCLTQSLRQRPYCPVCKEPLTVPTPSAFATAQVSALDVVCVHGECNWKGTCGRLDAHLDGDCLYEAVTCSGEGGCGEIVPRGKIAEHRWYECNLRLVRCPNQGCEITTAYNQIPAHLEICPYTLISCPLQCGASRLTRGSLGAHRRDCTKEHVACVYVPLGCSHVAPRDQIAQHEQDVGVHFVALSKAFVQQQQSHQQLQQSYTQLQQQLLQHMQQLQQSLSHKLQQQLQLSHEQLSHKLQQSHEQSIQSFEQHNCQQKEKFQVLEQQAAIFREDLHHLQPVVASAKNEALKTQAEATIPKAEPSKAKTKAKDKAMVKAKDESEARKVKARKDAEVMADDVIKELKCLWCNQAATKYYKNPQVLYQKHGFSGNCGGICVKYELHLESCCATETELVEAIVKELCWYQNAK